MENNMTKRFMGWSNYATFRVFDDVLRDFDFDDKVSAQELEECALHSIFSRYEIYSGSHLVEEYARMIMDLVSFEEIAQYINNNMKNMR